MNIANRCAGALKWCVLFLRILSGDFRAKLLISDTKCAVFVVTTKNLSSAVSLYCLGLVLQSPKSISLELVRETSEAFYKDVTRDGAEKLLMNKQNGTFVIRPSRKSKLGTLSVVQDFRIYHLNIRTREQDGNVALGREKDNEKCFASISSLINYYVSNYLILSSNGITTLTLLIPYRE